MTPDLAAALSRLHAAEARAARTPSDRAHFEAGERYYQAMAQDEKPAEVAGRGDEAFNQITSTVSNNGGFWGSIIGTAASIGKGVVDLATGHDPHGTEKAAARRAQKRAEDEAKANKAEAKAERTEAQQAADRLEREKLSAAAKLSAQQLAAQERFQVRAGLAALAALTIAAVAWTKKGK